MALRGDLDHGRRNVDPGCLRAACGRTRSSSSRARPDVEHAHARADPGGVEQRLDRQSRDRAQKLVVPIGGELQPAASNSSKARGSMSVIGASLHHTFTADACHRVEPLPRR